MAAAFTVTPTWVHPTEPEFHTITTLSENQKKNYIDLSGSTPVLKYKLLFEGLSDTDFWTLYNHYYSAKGGYDSFVWSSVPSYIDTDQDGTPDGSNITGRWVTGSFRFKPKANSWEAEIEFEKEVA